MIWLVYALLIHKSEFFASLCSCTGNPQDCKHRNNNQQTQMFKAGSHILEKVKRVSGSIVIIRIAADIKVQRREGAGTVRLGHCFLPAVSHGTPPAQPLAPPPPDSRMMRKQSEPKTSTTEQGCFRPRTIPIYLAGSLIKGVCPGT